MTDYFNPAHRARIERAAAKRRLEQKRQPAPPAVCPAPLQQSDEYVCPTCNIRWDTHEDRPPCPRR